MVTAEHACSGVKGQPAGGEEVLPDPLPTGSGVLPVEGVWQVHRSVGVAEIIIVEQPGSTELVLEGRVVTVDALLTQREIAEVIVEKGGTT